METSYQFPPKNPSDAPTFRIGYANPLDSTFEGIVISGGQLEKRIINVESNAPLVITTFRCDCDFEVVTMEPMEGGSR